MASSGDPDNHSRHAQICEIRFDKIELERGGCRRGQYNNSGTDYLVMVIMGCYTTVCLLAVFSVTCLYFAVDPASGSKCYIIFTQFLYML